MVTQSTDGESTVKQFVAQINRLHFYPDNPRRQHMHDEDEIRRVLCEDESVVNLAKHISEHGLNPLDLPAVIAHPKLPGHFVVVEGNRRLCAIQLLRDPKRAPTPASQKIFSKLKSDDESFLSKVDVVYFLSIDAARTWMSVRHEGEQGGVGSVGWDAGQIARFNKKGVRSVSKPKNPNLQALALLDYAQTNKFLTEKERSSIPITTLTRYLSTPNVRAALALLNNEDLTTDALLVQFDSAIRRFLSDALPAEVSGVLPAVRSRTSSTDRKAYAEKLRQDGPAATVRDQIPYSPAAKVSHAAAVEKAGAMGTTSRSKPNPDTRRFLISASFREPTGDKTLARLVNEGKTLVVDDFVFSANFLVRAILERIIVLYASWHGIGSSKRPLAKLIATCAMHLEKMTPSTHDKIIQVMNKTASNEHAITAPDTLGAGVHGAIVPQAKDVRRSWDTLEPVFTCLLMHRKQ